MLKKLGACVVMALVGAALVQFSGPASGPDPNIPGMIGAVLLVLGGLGVVVFPLAALVAARRT